MIILPIPGHAESMRAAGTAREAARMIHAITAPADTDLDWHTAACHCVNVACRMDAVAAMLADDTTDRIERAAQVAECLESAVDSAMAAAGAQKRSTPERVPTREAAPVLDVIYGIPAAISRASAAWVAAGRMPP